MIHCLDEEAMRCLIFSGFPMRNGDASSRCCLRTFAARSGLMIAGCWAGSCMRCAALWRALGGLRGRLRAEEDALQPLRPLVRARHLGRHFQCAGRGRRRPRPIVHRQLLHQGPSLRGRRKRGALAHGIGRTKGGRNTKLHAVCDEKGRPLVLLLTPGNVHDCKLAQRCIEAMPPSAELVADKGYDSQTLREWLKARGTQPVIPPRKNRKIQYEYDKVIYKQRNVIERMFCPSRTGGASPLGRSQHHILYGRHRPCRRRHLVAVMRPDPRRQVFSLRI